ncbi:arylsulfatase [Algoriphagus aquimarinus]|uniref:sulfatase family protein n=1 Tax=Algoriphagus aquimarinus TaxID=237018 RepID=UPI0030D821F5|tara:strand:- start:5547 stop:7109 length:1563 start_codon:yes stop_codon:yes gene_type:complete
MKYLHQLLVLVLTFQIFSCSPNVPEQEKLPNIIIILADDLGYGDIGAFNRDSKIPTPHIDALAAGGMKFTDAHTPSAVCTPTRYGFLTGRYNWRSRLKSGVLTGKSNSLIPDDRTTIADVLKGQGYNTAFIGKWHLGWDWALKDGVGSTGEGWDPGDFDAIDFSKPVTHTPNDLGFDYAYGHSGSLDMAPYVYVENGMPTAIPDTVTVNTGKYSWWREGPTSPDFDHEKVTPNFFERSIQYIEEKGKDEKPFFLYLALPSPHTPILPPAEWQGKSGLMPFGDFMMMIDDYVGQVNAAIKRAGIEENTLVIFTSDNGGSPAAGLEEMAALGHLSNYTFRGNKADLYEGGHRVPFIAKWPANIKPGTTRDHTICLIDIMATSAEITGYTLKDNEGEDSYSLMELFDADKEIDEFREATVHHSINGSFAIRQGDWKLLMAKGSGGWSFPKPGDPAEAELPEVQLYNLASDPGETTNVYAENPEKVAALKSLLSKYIKEGRSTPGAPQQNDKVEGEWKQIGFVE